MAETGFKIAFIGSHGVGKTTLCYGLAARLKAQDQAVEVVHEVARRCPLPINAATTAAAQRWILHTQIAEETVASARYPVVICDRSVLDNYVYFLLAAGPDATLERLVGDWLRTYTVLVHVPLVKLPQPDGIRAADPTFQRSVADRLEREIATRHVAILGLDAGDSEGWLDAVESAVLAQIRPPQLPLLEG